MQDYQIIVLTEPKDVVVKQTVSTISVEGFGGYVGPTGPQGSTIYAESGTTWNWGLPRVEGDLFINTENYDVFRYTVDEWVQIGNIKGVQGPVGEWVALTQAEYNALDPKNPAFLYVII